MLKIKLLKALNGDSIIISYGEEKTHNILIDGGCGKLCYRQLCRYIEDMKKEKNIIDLVVLPHIFIAVDENGIDVEENKYDNRLL